MLGTRLAEGPLGQLGRRSDDRLAPGVGNTVDLGAVRLTNQGELRALSGTTNVSLTNLTGPASLTGGTITAQGGTLGLNANLVTNNATVTVVTGGINNTSTGDQRAARAADQQRHPDPVPVGERYRPGDQHRHRLARSPGRSARCRRTPRPAGSTRVDAPAVLKGWHRRHRCHRDQRRHPDRRWHGPGAGDQRCSGAAGRCRDPAGGHREPTPRPSAGTLRCPRQRHHDSGDALLQADRDRCGQPYRNTRDPDRGRRGPAGRHDRADPRGGVPHRTFSSITGRDTLPLGKYWGVTYDATGVTPAR